MIPQTMVAFPKKCGFFVVPFLILSFAALCHSQAKQKIAYGVFVDNSGSMRSQFDEVIRISKAVVHQIHEHGPVSIFDFHSQGRLKDARAIARIEQVQDETLLQQCIDDIYIEGGPTTLLDAIQLMAEHLGDKAGGPDFSERVIILITDGEDRRSVVRQKQLLQKLSDRKIRVYAIGLVQDLSSASRFKAVELLSDITKETSGRAVFPKSDNQDPQSLLAELAIPIP